MLIVVPVLTMRLFAEEKRSGTIETLMTAPVTDAAVVLAKYAGALAFFVIMWLPTVVYAFILKRSAPLGRRWTSGRMLARLPRRVPRRRVVHLDRGLLLVADEQPDRRRRSCASPTSACSSSRAFIHVPRAERPRGRDVGGLRLVRLAHARFSRGARWTRGPSCSTLTGHRVHAVRHGEGGRIQEVEVTVSQPRPTAGKQDARDGRGGAPPAGGHQPEHAPWPSCWPAALLGMVNYLSYRHYARADWSRAGYYALSDKTQGLLAGADQPMSTSIVFFQPQQDDLRGRATTCSGSTSTRSKPDSAWSGSIPTATWPRTEELVRKYEVAAPNVVVVRSARPQQVRRARTRSWISRHRRCCGRAARAARPSRGEQAFSSAIQSCHARRRPVVVLPRGPRRARHRQLQPTGRLLRHRARRSGGTTSRSASSGSASQQAIPEDCRRAGHRGPAEAFLGAGAEPAPRLPGAEGPPAGPAGRHDAQVGLEPLLEDWGVRLAGRRGGGRDPHADRPRAVRDRSTAPTPSPASWTTWPPSSTCRGPSSHLDGAPTKPAGRRTGRDVTALAGPAAGGVAETDLTESPDEVRSGADRPGPVSMAVAVEKGPAPGIDVQIRPTRLVACRRLRLCRQRAPLAGGNGDLFLLSAQLAAATATTCLAIGPKPLDQLP